MPKPPLALILAALLVVSAVSGCVALNAPPPQLHCEAFRPILIGEEDILTDETAVQIEIHNEVGLALGCWDPPPSATGRDVPADIEEAEHH